MTTDTADAAVQLCALVAPWLPDAEVETLYVQESCCCYSEWTQDPPYFRLTFRATHYSEEKLSHLIAALEPIILQWAMSHYTFSGGTCCQGDDYKDGDRVEPSMDVRVIPRKPMKVNA